MILLVAVCLIAAVGSMAYAGASGISDPTITVTQFTTPDKLRDKTHESLDSLDTAVEASIDVLDAIAGGTQDVTLAPASILVGNASSNQAAVAVSGDATINTNGAVTLVDGITRDTEVWGSATVTPVITVKEAVVAIAANDIAGSPVAGYRLLRVWTSETAGGAASTNNIETLVLSTGAAISTETANADYYYVTAAAGTAVATVTGTAIATNYLNVADGSTVSSSAMVFE